jgi:hypothetical protein
MTLPLWQEQIEILELIATRAGENPHLQQLSGIARTGLLHNEEGRVSEFEKELIKDAYVQAIDLLAEMVSPVTQQDFDNTLKQVNATLGRRGHRIAGVRINEGRNRTNLREALPPSLPSGERRKCIDLAARLRESIDDTMALNISDDRNG